MWTVWEHKITKQSYIDQHEVLHMLASCAAGSSDLCSEKINCEVDIITQDFRTNAVGQWKVLINMFINFVYLCSLCSLTCNYSIRFSLLQHGYSFNSAFGLIKHFGFVSGVCACTPTTQHICFILACHYMCDMCITLYVCMCICDHLWIK